jgi:hydroxymethylglutaryl-CoA lyase
MSDLPKRVHISEEGPREGFQFEKGAIPTARKIALIDALAQTGIDQIQIVSFVNPKAVPGMADAEDVVHGITPKLDVAYTALWLNDKGFERSSWPRRKNFCCATRTATSRSSSPASIRSSKCTRRAACRSSAAA